MKAITFSRFGGPEVLTYQEDFPIPSPGPREVLMQVHAHGLNPKDYSIRSGHLQWITGKRFPMQIGSDAAGVVEAVGEKVTHWKPGDRVFGYLNLYHGGAASEFCRFSEKAIARIPEGVDY
ncbi:MAG TPA: hypothetical protein DCE41_16120, partial [Cytophagales bacterium]|nr:hypothetical protein [Cytophagales bacterium]